MAGLLAPIGSFNKVARTTGTGDGRGFSYSQDYSSRRIEHDDDEHGTRQLGRAFSSKHAAERQQEDAANEETVARIARGLSRMSTMRPVQQGGPNPFEPSEESTINPNGPNFKARDWVRAMILNSSPEIQRTSGLAFRNLNVRGEGDDLSYQSTFGNGWLKTLGPLRAFVSGNKGRRIDILQNFDGLIKAGEMLVVLGPPGRCGGRYSPQRCSEAHSGCSTLLKTIAGEWHGFSVDAESHLNYAGIGAERMHKQYRGEAIYAAEVRTRRTRPGAILIFPAGRRPFPAAHRRRHPALCRIRSLAAQPSARYQAMALCRAFARRYYGHTRCACSSRERDVT
jgi:hypothetical protein